MTDIPWWQDYFDDLYIELSQELAPDRQQVGQEQAEAAVQITQLTPPARMLDLCCGSGRHAIALANLGFEVTGLDYSDAMLARAFEAAKLAGADIDFRQGDMRELPWVEEFDGCLMLGGSFGIFEEERENERVFRAVATALKPDGRFVLDVANRDRAVCNYQPCRRQEAGGLVRCIESHFDPVSGINRARECWLRDGEWTERTHHRRLYTATELDKMLRRAGLSPIAYHSGYDLSEFTVMSHRLLVAARKERQ